MLPKQPYVINRPLYHHEESPDGQMRAIVILPSVLHPYLQETKSLQWWPSRKLANADAALQAYKALLAAGLVNDYLLPTNPSKIFNPGLSASKAIHIVLEPVNPWAKLAARWNTRDLALYSHLTHLILQSVHGHLLKPELRLDFVALFVPDAAPAAIETFLEANTGRLRQDDALKTAERTRPPGLLRGPKLSLFPWIMDSWPSGPSYSTEDLRGGVQPLPRRRNFLPPCPSRALKLGYSAPSHEAQNKCFEDQHLTMDRLPFTWAQAALYIPSITHEISVCMVAEHLQEKLLLDVTFRSLDLLSLAIRPTCSERPARFWSLAFMGATFPEYIIN
ncbi:dicer-like protein 2 [Penicillium malachiteum]|uniref:dicer-like protein 2 n=1 Tax=Penicillium malachiteum TaxID=1324776 RepID=UPI00254840F0|nr:dicer-like protein 2 [Penicillium malachiteum]KAJ5729089.1 dicer-like protein 2 [Penicillium malachiteum]